MTNYTLFLSNVLVKSQQIPEKVNEKVKVHMQKQAFYQGNYSKPLS
ncbi:MAG: hypothetical protein IJ194_00445 [Bacilli bacterium]|nr:hypothetical protein [Bacilli bacterium]